MKNENSPWGKVQSATEILPGIWEVGTARHGGLMIESKLARAIFPPRAIMRDCFAGALFQNRLGSWYTYEEDCAICIAIYELLHCRLLSEAYEKKLRISREQAIEQCLATFKAYYPNYLNEAQ